MFTTSYITYSDVTSQTRSSSSTSNPYYILPTSDEDKITWDTNPQQQEFTLIPSINNLQFKLNLKVRTNNYLPDDSYLLDLVFGNVTINNVTLNWVSSNKDEEIVKFSCNQFIMLDNQQLNELTSHNEINFQIKFKLNKEVLAGAEINSKSINELDLAMRQNDTFNFQLNFANFFSTSLTSGTIPFACRYEFQNNHLRTITENYFYNVKFARQIDEFNAIQNILEFIPSKQTPSVNWNDSAIQLDFFYHDNNDQDGKEQHLTITEKQFLPKSWDHQILSLPNRLQYSTNGHFQESEYGSGFFLPFGGFGNLVLTMDFNIHGLAKKITWKWPFEFKNSLNKIQASARAISLNNLDDFHSFGVTNNA